MESEKYGKERIIRLKYRRGGGRRTYRQRRVHERGRGSDRDGLMSRSVDAEDLVGSTLSVSLGRSFVLNHRRRVLRGLRTLSPGRFRHELRKRYERGRRRRTRGRSRIWIWYRSEVDLNRKDRRRSRSFFRPRFGIKRRKQRGGSTNQRRTENRKRRIWAGRIRYTLIIQDRREFSNRRSRLRTRLGYILCIEVWRRRRYRREGRKNPGEKEENDKS